MKINLLLLLLTLLLSSVAAQDLALFNGAWKVSEAVDEEYRFDVWQFKDGSFCELKYASDGLEEMLCDETGIYEVTDSLLIISVLSDDGEKYEAPQIVQFKYQYIDTYFELEVFVDRSHAMKNVVSKRLIMTRLE